MNALTTQRLQCPYCGESISIVIDCSLDQQQYIEDCEVCCKPINLNIDILEDGKIKLSSSTEYDC